MVFCWRAWTTLLQARAQNFQNNFYTHLKVCSKNQKQKGLNSKHFSKKAKQKTKLSRKNFLVSLRVCAQKFTNHERAQLKVLAPCSDAQIIIRNKTFRFKWQKTETHNPRWQFAPQIIIQISLLGLVKPHNHNPSISKIPIIITRWIMAQSADYVLKNKVVPPKKKDGGFHCNPLKK